MGRGQGTEWSYDIVSPVIRIMQSAMGSEMMGAIETFQTCIVDSLNCVQILKIIQ